jgi:hypothetical protein
MNKVDQIIEKIDALQEPENITSVEKMKNLATKVGDIVQNFNSLNDEAKLQVSNIGKLQKIIGFINDENKMEAFRKKCQEKQIKEPTKPEENEPSPEQVKRVAQRKKMIEEEKPAVPPPIEKQIIIEPIEYRNPFDNQIKEKFDQIKQKANGEKQKEVCQQIDAMQEDIKKTMGNAGKVPKLNQKKEEQTENKSSSDIEDIEKISDENEEEKNNGLDVGKKANPISKIRAENKRKETLKKQKIKAIKESASQNMDNYYDPVQPKDVDQEHEKKEVNRRELILKVGAAVLVVVASVVGTVLAVLYL